MTTNSKPLPENPSIAEQPRASATRLAHLEAEHNRIASLLEKATQAFVRQASPSEVNGILLELSGYTLTHFREEEELMCSFAFAGFDAHKDEHDRLAVHVRGLLDIASKQEALQSAVKTLHIWLDAHIRVTDKLFTDFLLRKTKQI
jgi:hemerythrin